MKVKNYTPKIYEYEFLYEIYTNFTEVEIITIIRYIKWIFNYIDDLRSDNYFFFQDHYTKVIYNMNQEIQLRIDIDFNKPDSMLIDKNNYPTSRIEFSIIFDNIDVFSKTYLIDEDCYYKEVLDIVKVAKIMKQNSSKNIKSNNIKSCRLYLNINKDHLVPVFNYNNNGQINYNKDLYRNIEEYIKCICYYYNWKNHIDIKDLNLELKDKFFINNEKAQSTLLDYMIVFCRRIGDSKFNTLRAIFYELENYYLSDNKKENFNFNPEVIGYLRNEKCSFIWTYLNM